jgi:hypothetical protein
MKWSDLQYNHTSAKLAAGLIEAYWTSMDGGGYRASVFGRSLKGMFGSINEAKSAAMNGARHVLGRSLAQLDKE